MNIIGIDPSLVSTAMTINGDHLFNYTKEKSATNKSGLNKWYNMCEDYVNYRWIEYTKVEGYSDSEITKLKEYDLLTSMVIDDIKKYADLSKETLIGIEGYSYSSAAGPLIDLVTYGTLLRNKLVLLGDNVDVRVLAPSTLKLESAKLTYSMIKEGGKEMWRNNNGLSGGTFKKHDMYKALTENDFKCKWVKFLREIESDVFDSKTIKKPIDDVNDSYLIYKVLENIKKD
jgi:hypothetical protein